jgi:hypothetical protein
LPVPGGPAMSSARPAILRARMSSTTMPHAWVVRWGWGVGKVKLGA